MQLNKDSEMRGLWAVKPGCFVQAPDAIEGQNRTWAMGGTVLDLDDPYFRDLIRGQERKFQPADEGAKASVITDERITIYRRVWERQRQKKPVVRESVQEATERASQSGLSAGIPAPDERPKAKAKGEKATVAGGAQSA